MKISRGEIFTRLGPKGEAARVVSVGAGADHQMTNFWKVDLGCPCIFSARNFVTSKFCHVLGKSAQRVMFILWSADTCLESIIYHTFFFFFFTHVKLLDENLFKHSYKHECRTAYSILQIITISVSKLVRVGYFKRFDCCRTWAAMCWIDGCRRASSEVCLLCFAS